MIDVVVPTAGRDSLAALLDALAGDGERIGAAGASLGRVIVVDDRRGAAARDPLPPVAGAGRLGDRLHVVRGGGAGPAAARNVGWRSSDAEWVAFLDDDVVPTEGWLGDLAADLAGAGAGTGAVQGAVRVPRPADRRPTDWERNVAGLENARWATADMAYRREALEAVDGFDERFPRPYREDADLGLRVTAAGWRIEHGARAVTHPVRSAGALVSVRLQAGNADDALMRTLHGSHWREAAGAPPGRLRRHVAITVAGLGALAGAALGHPRTAAAAAALWLAGTAELAWARIAPGPRTAGEVTRMVVTSVLLPGAAVGHRLAGEARRARRLARPGPEVARGARDASRAAVARDRDGPCTAPPDAVLLDRDGTLIVDVPYNGDPERVVPMAGAREALERLRAARVPIGVVSNQSGVARGLIAPDEVAAVNARVEELLGPLGPWAICPHGPEEGCTCRKPAPGLVLEAAGRLGVDPRRCVVVGDIGADVEAARAAGARGVLVPTDRTLPEEVEAAAEVAQDLPGAVDLVLAGTAAG
ncbi:MAG: HAD-IIIA family hydrolase [Thermoleophilaceae bacterium]